MQPLANVALPVAVDSTFTYQIPPELVASARIGVRVIVPFGRKYSTGLIVELPESTTLTALKPLKDILDASPIVSDEMLRLCRWISEYYFAPLGEVIRAAVPHGFALSNKRLVKLHPDASPTLIEEAKRTSHKRARLLELLAASGEMLARELQKKTGLRDMNAVLNEFERNGVILTEEVLPLPKTKLPTKEYVVVATIDDGTLDEHLRNLSARKKKARQLLEFLTSLKQEGVQDIVVSELLKRAGVGTTTLKEWRAFLPIEKRIVTAQQEIGTEEQTLAISLNEMQQAVLARITEALHANENKTFLLHGVTGSGKTQVYIEAIRHCLNRGKTAIVLVPEISLTPQTARRFKSHFAEHVAVVHSNMSANERHQVWHKARLGEYKLVVGPRSAVFAPLANLGLIVVDEEHEPSYKQFDPTPRYHARDVAIVRGKNTNAVVVLGSATPSAESYFNAVHGKYTLLEMPERVQQVALPHVSIVNMTEERKREYFEMKATATAENRTKLREFQQSSFSPVLREKIEERLQRNEGIILLQNRRGFAPFIECMECGTTLMCSQCSITLTFHITRRHLRCHYCGKTMQPPSECPHCHGAYLSQRGAGTQRVEDELKTLFPSARVLRMDMDTTTRRGAHERLLRQFGDGEADILLGTQMVAKGLDFARVTLVGVISADTQLMLPDFRASERTFQLLTQVAGRAGRSTLAGEVVIQTHQPKHRVLHHVIDHDFKKFYQEEMEERKELNYPPFARLALVEFKGKDEGKVRIEAERFTKHLRAILGTFTLLGPAPAVVAKIKNQYRWHIILKAAKAKDPAGTELRYAIRKALADFGTRKSSVRLIVDIDPVGLM